MATKYNWHRLETVTSYKIGEFQISEVSKVRRKADEISVSKKGLNKSSRIIRTRNKIDYQVKKISDKIERKEARLLKIEREKVKTQELKKASKNRRALFAAKRKAKNNI